jgi:diguanylate cyclase (GGDEF)-like protein/PAS domain S-box-containing protein
LDKPIKLLLIEDNPSDALLLREHLTDAYGTKIALIQAQTLVEALQQLAAQAFDAVLCDLGLPDSQGLDTFCQIHARAGTAAIVLLTGLEDEEIGMRAVQTGAQDYLLKHELKGNLLPRAIRYALERKRAEQALRRAHDELEQRVEERTAELTQTLAQLSESEARFRMMAESISVMIWVAGPDDACTHFNRRWLEFTGHTLAQELGFGWTAAVHPDDLDQCLNGYTEAFKARVPFTLEYRMQRHDGVYRWLLDSGGPRYLPDGTLAGYIGGCIDITERKEAQQQLEVLASYDSLTNLPNRRLFHDRLEHALKRAARERTGAAVILIDLDNFKVINDTLGHDCGDWLLRAAAQRIAQCLRQEDTLARLGGDEFTVLCEGMHGAQGVARTTRRIIQSLSTPLRIDPHEITVTASFGISVYPADGEDLATLMKHADAAMYRAKAQGKNRYQFFTAEIQIKALERLAIESGLRRALEQREFSLVYQPLVDIASSRTVGREALIRWRSQEFGGTGPAQFIPIAEETGLIRPIGTWVLETACRQLRSWEKAGQAGLRLAVNLSPLQFKQKNIIHMIDRICRQTRIPPAWLELELTEGAIMEDTTAAAQILRALKALGISIAIDDFGTGYSSLGYLRRFPIDRLKVDRSFVQDLTTDPNAAEITKAIIAMAHSLKLKVVAEGVETRAQFEFLKMHGCDEAQGYYFQPPDLIGVHPLIF